MKVVELAKNTIELYLREGKVLEYHDKLEDCDIKQAATFVSIKTKEGNLRGCIGTLSPLYKNINTEITANAISAATRDPRFNPMSIEELEAAKISVDVLDEPFEVTDKSILDPKRYGVIVSTTDGRRGVLLPNLEGVNTAESQLDISLQKGSISPLESYKIEAFEVIRFK